MITLHIEVETFEELRAAAAKAVGIMIVADGANAAPQPETPSIIDAPRRGRPPKASQDVQVIKGEDLQTKLDAPESEPEGDASEVLDYATHIKPGVLKVSAKGGRPAVEALLKPYGVDNASKIPAAHYPQLMAAIEAALEG